MTRPNLNAVAILTAEHEGAVASTGFHVLRAHQGISPRWLYYLVRSGDFVKAMSSLVLGVLYPAVRPKDIRNYPILLPPVAEQDRIVAEIEKHFTRLDAAVAALKRVQANLKRYRAALLQAAVEGRLVPTEAELAQREGRACEDGEELLRRLCRARSVRTASPGGRTTRPLVASAPTHDVPAQHLPLGWVWVELGEMVERVGDVDHKMPKAQMTGVPYVSTRDFVGVDGIDFESAKLISLTDYTALCRKIRPDNGDILISRYGTIGAVRRLLTDRQLQVSYSIAILKLFKEPDIGPYLLHALRSGAVQLQMRGYVRASSQPDLGLEYIRRIRVPMPPLAEQVRIVAEVDRRLSVLHELEVEAQRTIKRADSLRQRILRLAFEGRLVPQDPRDEPASELLARIKQERQATSAATSSLRQGASGRRKRARSERPLFQE
jgi:type I restriction enzyme S subunit